MEQFRNPVSVIIVSNVLSDNLLGLVSNLQGQIAEFPKSEVLIVFNGPNSDFRSQFQFSENVRSFYIKEKSPYEARNLGVQAALNSYMAFVDADCVVGADWVKNIVNLQKYSFDLAAGSVVFETPKNAAALYDSISFLQTKDCFELRKVALTLNLVAKKSVFKKIGFFDSAAVSGADVEWSKRAVLAGFNLKYFEKLRVTHPCRGFIALMKKALRVGRGKFQSNWNLIEIFSTVQFRLLNPFYFRSRILEKAASAEASVSMAYGVGVLVMLLSLFSYSYSALVSFANLSLPVFKKKNLSA